MAEDILVRRANGVIEITLNRPEEGNGATDAMAAQVTKLLAEADQPVVLKGAGKDFCIGRAQMGRSQPTGPIDPLERRDSSDVIFDCYGAFRKARMPVIGAIQGRALGFGASIAALCDVTIAAESATFQVPEMLHNIMPTMVASALVDRVHRKALSWMIWSSEVIDARQAMAFGLVTQVVPDAQLDATVKKLTDRMLATPPVAVMAVKDFAKVAYDMPIAGAVDFARNLHATVNSSPQIKRK